MWLLLFGLLLGYAGGAISIACFGFMQRRRPKAYRVGADEGVTCMQPRVRFSGMHVRSEAINASPCLL
jgi:hypothetical protein